MKSLADLQAIRDKAKQQMDMRREHDGYRVVVGMATCGIAAGARPVMLALVDKVQREGIENVTVTQTGCIGICRYEPIVEVTNPDGTKATYVKMTAEKAERMIDRHIKKGTTVIEYTIGYEQQQEKN